MQQQHDGNQSTNDFRSGVNLLYLIADAHATCITIFIRHSMGENRPGFIGLCSLFMMFMTMAGQRDIRMLWMIEAWFLALIGQRLRTGYLIYRGWKEHSFYEGLPYLAMRIPFTKSEAQAKNAEPALCLLLGLLLVPVSPTIGGYVMLGCVSLIVVRTMQFATRRRQVVALQDMEIEQRNLSERVRGYRRDF